MIRVYCISALLVLLNHCHLTEQSLDNEVKPLQLKSTLAKIEKSPSLTFIVSGDMQVDRNDSFLSQAVISQAMNRVQYAFSLDKNRRPVSGYWPWRLASGGKTLLANRGQKIAKPSFIMKVGDLTMHTFIDEVKNYHRLYGESPYEFSVNMPVFTGLGNHDIHRIHALKYLDLLFEPVQTEGFVYNRDSRNYTFETQYYMFIQLNEFGGKYGTKDLQWLKQQLQRARKSRKKILIFQHYGLDDFSFCLNDAFANRVKTSDKCRWWNISQARALYKLLSQYEVVALFHGHWHVSGHCRWGKIPVFSAGGARDTADILLLRLDQNELHVAPVKYSGRGPQTVNTWFGNFFMGSWAFDDAKVCTFAGQTPRTIIH